MKKWKSLSRVRLYSSWNSPGQNTGVGSLSLLQGIFPTQGLNPRLLHCRQILYQLSHKGSPRLLQWVAYRFPSGLSQPRNGTWVSCIADGFFTNWAIRKALMVMRRLYWFGSSFSFVIRSDSVVSLNSASLMVPKQFKSICCHFENQGLNENWKLLLAGS